MQKKLEIIIGILVIIFLIISGVNIFITSKANEFSNIIKNLENIQEFSVSVQLQLENETISLDGNADMKNNTFSLVNGGLNSGFDSIKYIYIQEEEKIDYEIYLDKKKIYQTSILDIPNVDEYNINFLPSQLISDLENKEFKKVSKENYQVKVSSTEWLTYDNFFQMLHGKNYIEELDDENTMDLFLEEEKITRIVLKSSNNNKNELNINIKY